MKKEILILLTLTQISSYSQSQDSLIFKTYFKPETNYSQTIVQTTHTEMKYSGSEEFLQKLKEKGINNPTITDNESKSESVFKTGKLTDETNFPLTIEFVNSTSSDGKKAIPDGTFIYGHGSIGAMLTLDSLISIGLDEEYKKMLLQAIQSTYSQLSFPEKIVKVGESFSIKQPLSIPISGVTIEMDITTNYKLLNIINGIADFDVSQVYTMKSTITNYTINAKGSGNGKLLYDVLDNYNLKYHVDSEMEMNMKLDKFDLDLKTKTGFIQLTEIANNASR